MANDLLVGGVVNGQYKKTQASQDLTKTSNINTSKSEGKEGTQYNQDMFLQLLVAEMQYQDPLEPTDNSQYVAQLASFTQIEAIQAVQSNMDNIEANSLVGKYVEINEDGKVVDGVVDFVTKDDKKGLMVSVNGELYEKAHIQSVVNEDYYTAVYMASELTNRINALPAVESVTVNDGKVISNAVGYYNAMNEYQRGFVSLELLDKYQKVLAQYDKLVKAKEAAEKAKTEEQTSTSAVENSGATATTNSTETTATTETTGTDTTPVQGA